MLHQDHGDLIRLIATGDDRDGDWLRIHCDGYFIAELRTITELASLVDLTAAGRLTAEVRSGLQCAGNHNGS